MPRPQPQSEWGRWAWDAAERAARAYCASLATLITADQAITKFDAGFLELAYAAFVGFVISGVFSLAGKRKGAPDSASFLPPNTDPPQ